MKPDIFAFVVIMLVLSACGKNQVNPVLPVSPGSDAPCASLFENWACTDCDGTSQAPVKFDLSNMTYGTRFHPVAFTFQSNGVPCNFVFEASLSTLTFATETDPVDATPAVECQVEAEVYSYVVTCTELTAFGQHYAPAGVDEMR